MKKIKIESTPSRNRNLIRMRKKLLRSLHRVEQVFSPRGAQAIAEFREKLNAL